MFPKAEPLKMEIRYNHTDDPPIRLWDEDGKRVSSENASEGQLAALKIYAEECRSSEDASRIEAADAELRGQVKALLAMPHGTKVDPKGRAD